MHNSETTLQLLKRLGLSAKQSEMYLLLIKYHDLRIQDIVQLSHIPRSSVYENIRHLLSLGLVEELMIDTYKQYRACPIGVLRYSLDDTAVKLQQQRDNLAAVEQALSQYDTPGTGQTEVRYYKDRAGVRQILWNTLKAEDCVYVYSEWGRQQFVGLKFYENFATENRQRGLTERVLINHSAQVFDSIKTFTVSAAPHTRTRVDDIRVIHDGVDINGDTMIYNTTYAQIYLKNIELHGFEIENQDFVNMQRAIYETLWESARPVTEFLSSLS